MHGFFSNTFYVDILSEYNPFFTKQKYTKKETEFIFFNFLIIIFRAVLVIFSIL